jgi:hypothetical protein
MQETVIGRRCFKLGKDPLVFFGVEILDCWLASKLGSCLEFLDLDDIDDNSPARAAVQP